MHYAFLDLRTNSIESVWVSNGKMMTWLNRHMMMPYILPMLLKKSLGARMEMIVLRFTQSDMEHIRSELGEYEGMRPTPALRAFCHRESAITSHQRVHSPK